VFGSIGNGREKVVQRYDPGRIELKVSPQPYQDYTKAMAGVTSNTDVIVV
jgi:hypothetical protein